MLVFDLFLLFFKLLVFMWNIEEWILFLEKYIFKFYLKEDLKKWYFYFDFEYGGIL